MVLNEQPFNTGIKGSIIASFRDRKTEELVVFVSENSLDNYIVHDNPDGIYYKFDRNKDRWISSLRGEITGREPKLLEAPVIAYSFRSGDGMCGWHEAVVPHPKINLVLEFLYVSCVDEGQQPGTMNYNPDLTRILSTFNFKFTK